MSRVLGIALLTLLPATGAPAGQTQDVVSDVRGAISRGDFAAGDRMLSAYRGRSGVTPEMLEALSWMGRGSLAARQWDNAERYARQTYQLALAELKKRRLDLEPRPPIAIGAAIEVLAHVDAQRGGRTDAVRFLQRELATYKGTSIEKRIRWSARS